jgi:hypothetical protein
MAYVRTSRNRKSVRAFDATPITAGDIEVFHPECRTRILIIELAVRRRKDGVSFLYVEGICKRCDRYVRLQMVDSELSEAGAA